MLCRRRRGLWRILHGRARSPSRRSEPFGRRSLRRLAVGPWCCHRVSNMPCCLSHAARLKCVASQGSRDSPTGLWLSWLEARRHRALNVAAKRPRHLLYQPLGAVRLSSTPRCEPGLVPPLCLHCMPYTQNQITHDTWLRFLEP